MKMKIQSYGIDLTTFHDNKLEEGSIEPKYIMTSIESNNDHIIKDFYKHSPIIVKARSYVNLEGMLRNHLGCLGRYTADVLLLPPDFPWTLLQEDLPVISYGVSNPTTVEELDEIYGIHKINYISLDISPLYYNNEIMEWAKEKEIIVIGTNPMGGYLSAARNIQSFSIPFLLKFAAANLEIILVSGRRMDKAYEDMEFLESLVDTEGAEEYQIRKTIDKSVKAIKKAVDTFTNDSGTILKYDSPESIIPGVVTTLAGKKKENMGSLIKDDNPLQVFLDDIDIPEQYSQGEKLALLRYSATEFLKVKYDEGWQRFYEIIPNSVCAIRLHKPRVMKKKFLRGEILVEPEQNLFFYIYLTEDGNVFVKRDDKEV